MQTIRLRFTDQAAAVSALRSAGWLTVDPETSAETVPPLAYVSGTRCDIDMIGALYEQSGADEAGEPTTYPLPGYHVNLLWWGAEPFPIGDLEPFVVTPSHPLRTWLE